MVQKPVYVINGFLDSGKSSFFSYTIGQPYFQTSGTTLLIVCEEGEVEYSERLLRQTNTVMEVFENEEDQNTDLREYLLNTTECGTSESSGFPEPGDWSSRSR